ncbi:MAG TPA: tetratricopeptide repeat protein [Alphaproteobacteria bacterium]|nr:tetratricopeptide repeat protein [Alphaproteobacteria bacterium]
MSSALEEAIAHHRAGRLEAAELCYRQAREAAPHNALIAGLLGDVLQALGKDPDAETAYRGALRLDPSLAVVHMNLGLILRRQRRLGEALAALETASRRAPTLPEVQLNLGLVQYESGHADAAIAAYRAALALRPDYAEVYLNLGAAYHRQRDYGEAKAAYRAALKIQPGYAEAHYSLGVTFYDEGDLDGAAASYRRALALAPDHEGCRNNLAFVLQVLGRGAEAVELYRRGVAAGPHPATTARYLSLTSLYDPGTDLDARYRDQRKAEDRFARPLYRAVHHENVADTRRRLRIGYLSSDFRDHPVGRNIEPLLSARDRAGFEVFAYADVATPDRMTERFQAMVDTWRPIAGLSDEEVAAKIRADRVDILVVLAAHFDRNRPLVCAYRPAPVQISFHDLLTSGLEAVDYFIGDRTVLQRRPREQFTERIIRLPSIYAHAPLTNVPLTAPPSAASGKVTFGSFNNPAKINDQVLALWAKVLTAVPGSRLLLKFRNWYLVPSLQERISVTLCGLGVGPSQIQFDGAPDLTASHLARYGGVDIALDTFPFSGSTTTFEALWMGVPVVTLAGETVASRWSSSILRVLGLDELTAETPDAYVAAASALARDGPRLAALRAALRDRICRSPLVDARLRARQIERVYRAIWRRWCACAGGKI